MVAHLSGSQLPSLYTQRPFPDCKRRHVPVTALRRPKASISGALQLASPALATDQPLVQSTTAGPGASAEAPVPPVQPENERSVPRGLRPGRPLPVQAAEAPAPPSNGGSPSTTSATASGAADMPDKRPAAAPRPEQQDPATTATAGLPQQKPAADVAKPSKPATDAGKPSKAASAGEEGDKEAKRLLDEEEERRKQRRRKKGRIRELEEIRAELAEKELVLLSKEQELLERDQTVNVLREELELEKKLRTLLTKEKEKAEEQSALALGLCTGGSIF